MEIQTNALSNTIVLLKNYWDKVANSHYSTTTFNYEVFQKIVQNKNSAILDIGCGYGRILRNLHASGYKNSIGIDISQKMLERGRKETPYLHFRHTNGVPFEFGNHQFNVILLLGVLCSIVADQDQVDLISDIHRLLKKDGIVYISDFLITNNPENIKLYNDFISSDKKLPYGVIKLDGRTPPFRHHDPDWIKQLTKPFTTLYYNEEEFKTMTGGINGGFIYIGRLNKEK